MDLILQFSLRPALDRTRTRRWRVNTIGYLPTSPTSHLRPSSLQCFILRMASWINVYVHARLIVYILCIYFYFQCIYTSGGVANKIYIPVQLRRMNFLYQLNTHFFFFFFLLLLISFFIQWFNGIFMPPYFHITK